MTGDPRALADIATGGAEQDMFGVRAARNERVPVVGYTWFPFYTTVNWDYRTNGKPLGENLLHLGLYDLVKDDSGKLARRDTPLIEVYKGMFSSIR